MTDPLPKIWKTSSSPDTRNFRYLDLHMKRPILKFVYERERFEPVDPTNAPEYIYFEKKDLTESQKANLPDLMVIVDGFLVISQKFHDVLIQFNLGATRLFEVPLYENDQKTLRPGRWFILHVAATKKTLIPEHSQNIKEYPEKNNWGPTHMAEDILAVRASAAEGEDLWGDLQYRSRLFWSDRLKTAIEDAKLRLIHVPFRPCIVMA